MDYPENTEQPTPDEAVGLTIPDDLWGSMTPAPEQVAAVQLAAEQRRLIITGGPGVGKTATLCAVLRMYAANGLVVRLAALAGKAALRMKEQTGHDATTIHRLLEFAPGVGFRRSDADPVYDDEGKWISGGPVEADVVVLDEASMIDTALLAAVVRAVPPHGRLVLVGDVDQLPAIGPGQVLFDLIESGKVPFVRLTKIFRQASESAIPYVARAINEGAAPPTKNLPDVRFVPCELPETAANAIVELFCSVLRTPNGTRRAFDETEIMVASPQKTSPLGCEALNLAVQGNLRPHGDFVYIGGAYVARAGDRVIHTKNDYELGVFNGEVGYIERVSAGGFTKEEQRERGVASPRDKAMALVRFDDKLLPYTKPSLRDLLLAYAVTVHKLQGSQAAAVIVPVHDKLAWMLTRPLLYTAVTRAAEFVVLVGQEAMLERAARNVRGVRRRTTLAEMLR